MSVANRLNNPALSQAAHAGAWAVLVVIVPEENQLALYTKLLKLVGGKPLRQQTLQAKQKKIR